VVLVTSRDSLAGLVAVHGAYRLDLRPLPAPDAIGLLAALIGVRVVTEPGAAAALAEQCARLPLALRVAAELAVSRPTTPLSELVVELDGQAQRLELLDAGADPRAAVATVFSWSTRHLPDDAARAFALLGLHHGPDFDAYAVAALAGTDVSHAAMTLRILSNAHLVHPTGIGRYGMHDLLHAYAARVARGSADPGATETALGRLFDFYLAAAATAMDRLFPAESHRRPRGCRATTPLPELNDTQDARAWLDHELSTLVRFAEYAAQHGWPSHAVRLSPTLFRYLASGHFTDAMRIHESACGAARAVGDPAGEGYALLGLCEASYELKRTGVARKYAHQALSLFHQVGDRTGEARARYSLGMIDWVSGRYASAARHAAPALELASRASDHTGEAKAYSLLALISLDRGELDNAKDSLQRALALHRQWADRTGEAYTLHNLGCVEQRLHRHIAAATLQQNALTLFQRLGNRVGEAMTLDALGAAHAVLGRRDDAIRCLDTAVLIADEIGDLRTGSSARNNLGEIATAAGDFADALVHHAAAYAIASCTDAPAEQARSHAGQGRAYLAMGEQEQARIHLVEALNVYRELHLPEADEVEHLLASLAAPERPDRDTDRPARRAWTVRILNRATTATR
jgi:tetratricopeptide (TPR) repeat protein